MRRRRGDVAFYSFLASIWIVAAAFALWNHDRGSAHPPAAAAATHLTTTVASNHSRAVRAGHPARRQRTLTIRASRGPSWLAVRARSERGRVLYEGVLDQGETIEERGTAFWTKVGAVENVDVRVDHHLVRLGRSALRGVLLGAGRRASGPSARRTGVIGS